MDITAEKYYDDNLENYNLLNKIDPMTAKQAMQMMEEYNQAKLKLLGISNVEGSTLVEVEKPYIEDANNVLRGDIYTVDGRVSKCWILETDFDDIKCTHS